MSRESERLFEAMSDLNDEVIEEAAASQKKVKKPNWRRWGALAAVLVLAIGIAALFPRMGGNSGGSGVDGGTVFMSYAGPVFPLSLTAENDAITAARDITLDFSPWLPVWMSNEERVAACTDLTEEEKAERLADFNGLYPEGGYYKYSSDILVTDDYTLANTSDTNQTVSILYPFASSLQDLEAKQPTLTVDGVEVIADIIMGAYSGSFEGVVDKNGEYSEELLNLDQLNSWEEYKALMENGSYLEEAMKAAPDLSDTPVIVYEFADPWGPEETEEIPNPTIQVSWNMDYDETTILTYGFHGGSMDKENNWCAQSFSIPEKNDISYGRPYYLIVLGDDITNMTIQGYVTGGWDDDKEKTDAGVTTTRYETDLNTILRQVVHDAMDSEWEVNTPSTAAVEFERYYEALVEHLLAFGMLAEEPVERYDFGWLSDIIQEAGYVDRVFWLETEVTIPAGSSVKVTATLEKEPSFDHYCAHTENQGIDGYDVVTKLASNLRFTGQTATLEDRGQIEIVKQNFGFDLAAGIKTVTLDVDAEHYYLEVRRIKTDE